MRGPASMLADLDEQHGKVRRLIEPKRTQVSPGPSPLRSRQLGIRNIVPKACENKQVQP